MIAARLFIPTSLRRMTTTALATVETKARHDPKPGPMAGLLDREHCRVYRIARRNDAVRRVRCAARGLS